MLGALFESGFAVTRVLEPQPQPEFRLLEPRDYERLMRRPGFHLFSSQSSQLTNSAYLPTLTRG